MSLRQGLGAGKKPLEQSRKRRKISQACERCRERKIRCDGAKPICGTCKSKQQLYPDVNVCLYNSDLPVAATEREYIEVLHNQIHQLKQLSGNPRKDLDMSKSDNSFIEIESDLADAHGQCSVLVPASYLGSETPAIEVSSQVSSSKEAGPFNRPAVSTFYNKNENRNNRDSQQPMRSPIRTYSNSPSAVNSLNRTAARTARSDNLHTSTSASEIQHSEQPVVWSNANLEFQEELSPQMSAESQQNVLESTISAMGAAATTDNETPRSLPGFYGASSAISFFNEIQEELTNRSTELDAQPILSRNLKSKQDMPNPVKLLDFDPRVRLQDFHLPPRVLADYLLETYLDHVHSLYPIIHKSSFEAAYRQLWTSADNSGPPGPNLDIGLGSSSCPPSIFYCALNAIFALGCNCSTLSSQQKRELADTFCQRSLDLALGNLIDNSNLALVQALFILGQYLQSTDYPNRCWNVVGLAIRVAQGIGLYVDTAYNNSSPLETEIKRRTWHACLLLDVITGITLGRPTLPSGEATVPLPAAVDDIFLEGEVATNVQPDDIFSLNAFFVQTIQLYTIFGEVLTNVYKPWQDLSKHDQRLDKSLQNSVLGFVVDVENDLVEFKAQLPSELRWDGPKKGSSQWWIIERQQNILYTRFLHLKVLLYRPIFHQLYMQHRRNASLKLPSPEKTVMTLVTQRCSRACVENAQELINHIDRTSQTKAAGAWWYAIFYMFTCGMILILEDTNPAKEDDTIPQEAIQASWRKCLATLERLAVEHLTARKCAATLVKLREQALAAQKKNDMALDQHLNGEGSDNHAAIYPEEPAMQHPKDATQGSFETGTTAHDAWLSFDPLLLQDVLWQQPNGQLPWDVVDENWWQVVLDNS